MNASNPKPDGGVSVPTSQPLGADPRALRGRLTLAVVYGVLVFAAIITLIPFAYLIFSSFKTEEAFTSGPFWPTGDGGPFDVDFSGFTLDNYRNLAEQPNVFRAIVNSFFYASVSAVLGTLGAAMGGYALAKFRFRFRGFIDGVVLLALVIPGALLIAPGYQLLYQLGLLDTYAGLILPGIAPAFGVYLFRQAMISSLPDEMVEAARIDGCGEIRIFFLMALPMVRPMIGAFLLISFLFAWNNFIAPQIVLASPEKFPLSVFIAQLKGTYGTDYGLLTAGTLVAILPILALFLLLQKEFISGLTSGAVKG